MKKDSTMTDYVVCVRNLSKGAFGNEPGPTRFLRVPADTLPAPSQSTRRMTWVNEVLENAKTGTNPHTGRPVGDVLVFVHGYNNDQSIVMQRHRLLRSGLASVGYQGAVVSFDWPSADCAINYWEDRKDAKKTAIRLVDDCIVLFSVFQARGCEINVHVLAHSTGAYVVREAFDDADDRPRVAAVSWTVSQMAFIGGDVSARSMSADNAKASSIYRHCVRLTNYSNPYDSVLKLSNAKRVGVAPRVGRIGLPDDIPDNAVDVDCGYYWNSVGQHRPGIVGAIDHSWHIGDPVFTKDLYYTMEGNIDRHRIPTRGMDSSGTLSLQKK